MATTADISAALTDAGLNVVDAAIDSDPLPHHIIEFGGLADTPSGWALAAQVHIVVCPVAATGGCAAVEAAAVAALTALRDARTLAGSVSCSAVQAFTTEMYGYASPMLGVTVQYQDYG